MTPPLNALARSPLRVETHRMINAALKEEFARGLHALAIEAKAPA